MEAGSQRFPAPKRTAPKVGVPLVSGARLPLAFIIVGLVELATAALWLVSKPEILLQPHLVPDVLAVAHLLLPGFLLSVTYGAAYQLVPVVLGEPLRGEHSLWVHAALHTAGLVLLVVGFVKGRFDWVAAGGLPVGAGAMLFAWKTIGAFRRSARRDGIAWCLPLSALWLGLTVIAGVALALNNRWAFIPLSPLALLRAHAHLGLVGFFLTLLQGMSFQLVPMFTLGQVRRPRRVAAGVLCTQLGLSVLAPSLAWNSAVWGSSGIGVLLVGAALSGNEILSVLRSRRRRKLDTGLQAFVSGAFVLMLAGTVGVLLYFSQPSAATLKGAMAYGVLFIPGALALMVLGMLCKIVPFLVWMRVYGSKVGRQNVPPANSLPSASRERFWFVLHVASLVLMTWGAAFGGIALLRAGTFVFLAALGLFLASILLVLKHLLQPAVMPNAPVPAHHFSK